MNSGIIETPHILVVCMIVKNEEVYIEKTLQPFVDDGIKAYLILDTGSTDKTVEIINNYFIKNNITDGIVISKDYLNNDNYIDYSLMRNDALTLCRQLFVKSFYMVMPDCEWYLTKPRNIVHFCQENYEQDVALGIDLHSMDIEINEMCYNKQIIFRIDGNAHYKEPVHEYINGIQGTRLPYDVCHIKYTGSTEGYEKSRARWRNRDLPTLLKHIKNNPNNARTYFYLAQTYECLGESENAIKYYKERVEKFPNEFHEEIYMCLLRIGKGYVSLNKDEQAMEYFLKAYQFRPSRIESLVLMCRYYETKKFECVQFRYMYAHLACLTEFPTSDVLFVEKQSYVYDRYFHLGMSAWYMKQYEEGYNAFIKCLEFNPHDQIVLNNIKCYEKFVDNYDHDFINQYKHSNNKEE